MAKTIALTSTANGLSARTIFLPYDKNLVFVRAPDWSSSKAAQLHTSPVNVAGSFAAENVDLAGETVLSVTKDVSFVVDGPVFAKLHLTNPGTGASLVFHDQYAPSGDDIGNWLLEQLAWNDYGVWSDDATWSES